LELDSPWVYRNLRQTDCYEGWKIVTSRSKLHVTRKNISAIVTAELVRSLD
jgi:hypothetical protein